ncbi:hypothetical protein RHSIM_Rhsim01G0039500 [Rhododendron simsii]|uniref:RNase H type-1 domain-containing protein n=1 Tax=Rhododendron simsii TaxID=118357 RepID=A0A834HEY5_RHOSS|nr:hypothetical protein RHSIM_Rhsim01G0039500 [Rhododendron simsii]
MLREEMYVHQRSRVNWLRFGDKNTAFFHATLMQRRQRNQLCTIKDGRGIWLNEETEIRRHLGEFFSNLFEASGERDFTAALNFKIATPKPHGCQIQKVSRVIRQGMQGWDVNKLKGVISEEEVSAIRKIALPSNPRRDRLIWHYNSQGIPSEMPIDVDLVFRASKAQTEFELISTIQREVLEHSVAPPSANLAWRKPIPGSLKINCDVAIPLSSEKATAAMVVRNEVGELVDGSTATFPVSSVLQGELEAIKRACFMVEGLKKSLKVEWVKRSGNKIAYQVAAWASKGHLQPDWVSNPPVALLSLLYSDVINSEV